jgi:hypothetical protein
MQAKRWVLAHLLSLRAIVSRATVNEWDVRSG